MNFIQHHTQYLDSLLPSTGGTDVYEIRIHNPFSIDKHFFYDVPANTPILINQGYEEYDLVKLQDYHNIAPENYTGIFADTPVGRVCTALEYAGIEQHMCHWASPDFYTKDRIPLDCTINFHYWDENKMRYLLGIGDIPTANYNRDFKYRYAALNAGNHKNFYKIDFVYKLWLANLLDKGLVSLNNFEDTCPDPTLIEEYWLRFPDHFTDLLPFERDWNPNTEQQSSRDYSELHNVKILAVTETLIESNYCYISPKTWRAIACKKPFVVVGNRGLLKKLQDMGFITFSDYWDESYDTLELHDRMDAVIEILKQDPDLTGVEDILEHNYNLLVNTDWTNNLISSIQSVINA
jgi:hypothetical protein|tara:strand:- start:500 stop:1549 length:1050 start_codon:yes stop_codon:yes gene_type:complete